MPEKKEHLRAIGRRKEATAVAKLSPGKGAITVNGIDFKQYFTTIPLQEALRSPLVSTNLISSYDIEIKTSGGGKTGQAEGGRLAIARALLLSNPELRMPLRAQGFLTRDPRAKERKKPGLKRARRAPQWQKR